MMPSAGQERGLGPRAVTASAPTWAIRVYLAAFAVLTAVYFEMPSWRGGTWATMGLFATAAMLWGVHRYRPLHRAPWLLLVGAVATLVATDAVDISGNARSNAQVDFFPNSDWFPTVPEEVALAAYPLATVGFWLFIRHQRSGRDGAAIIDALIVITAVALLAWTFIVWPTVDDPDRTSLSREVAVCYPLGDILLLAVLARLLTGADERPPAAWLLGFGTLGLLASDLFFELRLTYSTW